VPERKFLPQGINHGERFAEAEEASTDFFLSVTEERRIGKSGVQIASGITEKSIG